MLMPLLSVHNLYAGYQGINILKGINLEVYPGEIVCVIGPNGAGKSTVFKSIYGLIPVHKGSVKLNERDITHLRPQDILNSGISIVPQLRSVFPQMTVMENLDMGMYLERDAKQRKLRIADILDLFPRLAERRNQMAGTMSGGEQRILEIGQALLLEPKLVMMAEPSAGLDPLITRKIFDTIQRLNRETYVTVLMIEQNARQGLETSHRGYVLEMGRDSHAGSARALLENGEIRRAFLGG